MRVDTIAFRVLTLISFCLVSCLSQAQDWQLKKEKGDIKVYTRKSKISKFDEYKVEGIVRSSIDTILSRLQNEKDIQFIFDDTKEARVLETNGVDRFVVFLHTNAPFPVSDRGSSYVNKVIRNTNGNVHIDIQCNDAYKVKKKGIVQLKYCKGLWSFEKIDDQRIKAVHQMLVDPGGSIPAWMTKKKTINSPFYTMTALKQLVENRD